MTWRGSASLKLCAEEASSPWSQWTSAASQCIDKDIAIATEIHININILGIDVKFQSNFFCIYFALLLVFVEYEKVAKNIIYLTDPV